MLKEFLLAFIPIFVAVDAIGTLPIYVSLTHDLNQNEKNRVIGQSLITATALAVGFIFLGKATFRFLGITIADFMVAGGIILMCIAIMDLLNPNKQPRVSAEEISAVPLGTPLMVGPGVLTTSLIMIDLYGVAATVAAVVINILFAGFLFINSAIILKVVGKSGARVLSKVMALLLAAIAVMMIRKGIFQIIHF